MSASPDPPLPLVPEARSAPEPARRLNWVLFCTALFLPTLVTVLSARAFEGFAIGTALFGGVLSGIVCGVLLGRRVGHTQTARIFLSILFVGVMSVVCVTMNCFGCAAGGFKMNFH